MPTLHVSVSGAQPSNASPDCSRLMKAHPMGSEDALVLASNSGGNAVSVELLFSPGSEGSL